MGLLVLTAFVVWEHRSTHPMLQLRFFRRRAFSGAVTSIGFVMFGLFGTLFVLTQYLQFVLGYTPLQAGIRALPAAGAIAVVAPMSAALVARAGTRVTITSALCVISAGLWLLSRTTTGSTYGDIVVGMVLLGSARAGHPFGHWVGHGIAAAATYRRRRRNQRHLPTSRRRSRSRCHRQPADHPLPRPHRQRRAAPHAARGP